MPGLHAERHHRRLLGHDSEHAADPARDADDERAVADRDDHARRRPAELLEDLLADRRVAVELGRLGAVLEEGQPVALPRAPCARPLDSSRSTLTRCSSAPSRSSSPSFASLASSGTNTTRSHAEPLSRPCGGGPVVAGRGGDHGVGATLPVRPERRQRSTPLERAELVHVLALQEQ